MKSRTKSTRENITIATSKSRKISEEPSKHKKNVINKKDEG